MLAKPTAEFKGPRAALEEMVLCWWDGEEEYLKEIHNVEPK